MSLSKQLLILLSGLFLIIFSVNFILSVGNTRDYLEGEAEVHAQDTATSLGLSLSPYMADEKDPVIETMMSAIFDMGYYQEITLLNLEGETLISLKNPAKYAGVPAWFIENLPMKTAMAESEISSGWNISGVLQVTTSAGYAYSKLYEQVKTSFYISFLIFILSILLLSLLLQVTLSSLKKIGQTALEISDGHFKTIQPLPWTSEVRQVASSINIMSSKIEGAINSLNAKLQTIGSKLQQDDLTGLPKKESFETNIKRLFIDQGKGYIFIIKIDVLSHLVKELGDTEVEIFIKKFAQLLLDIEHDFNHLQVSSYRFYGSEFALLMEKGEHQEADLLAKALSKRFEKLGLQYQKSDVVHIGITPFSQISNTSEMLLAANEAYEQARLIGNNDYYIREGVEKAMDISEWKALVFDVVESQDYTLSFVSPCINFKQSETLMEDVFTRVVDKNKDPVSIGTFVSIAEKFVKIVDLDRGVTLKVIDHIKGQAISHAIAISLSTRTIKSSDFRLWLTRVLEANKTSAAKLVFSFSAYAVAKEMNVYKEFIDFIQNLGAKVMIKRFETGSMPADELISLKPDYVRLARELSKEISVNLEKQAFVETMKDIGNLSNISILAENVNTDRDFARIKEIGILGASR